MDAKEQAQKLGAIRTLSRDELQGWWRYVITRAYRPAFDGERAELLNRARVLGVTLEE